MVAVAYKRFQIIVIDWLLRRGGLLQEVIATGGLTVTEFELAEFSGKSFRYRNSSLKSGMKTLMEWSALFWRGGNLSVYLKKR